VVGKQRQSTFAIALLFSAVLCGHVALPVSFSPSSNSSPQPGAGGTSYAAAKKRPPTKKKKARRSTPRVRRIHQAFVASASLKPMAQQLLQDRTPAAYAGVEAYARRHAKEDAGALAWLVLGYAHWLDHDQAKAIDAFVRARSRAGDLGDYVDYYLGAAYFESGRAADAISLLEDFEKDYPESLLIRDERIVFANALVAAGKAQEAVSLLERDRQPTRAEMELTLGRAYLTLGDQAKVAHILGNLYVTMPLSGEANQAEIELRKLPADLQSAAVGINGRRTRADLLMKGRRFNEAANEYRDLLTQVSPDERPQVQLALAVAQRHAGQNKDARKALESLPSSTPELNAERWFNLGEIARAMDDDDGFLQTLAELRQAAPSSPWLEQALLSAGNIYLLRRDYDKAIDCYRELEQRFPKGARAPYAHWKVAWLSLRQGRNGEAKNLFEQQIALYPGSGEVPAALYWRGRLAEEDNDLPLAQAYYRKISDRFRNFYYGDLARQRMAKFQADDDPPHLALLDRVPPIKTAPPLSADETPTDNLRFQKAHLLANGALLEFAVRELQAAANEEKGSWAPPEMAHLYQEASRYDASIETLKRAVPDYFALNLSSLPRPYWEALFPKPYWADLKRFCSQNALDPYLIASLIRQESEFNPNAVSRKNAVGLMQLLPKVGKGVAKQEKLKHFSPQQLFNPAVNLQLGTRYFRGMVDKFGTFEYALAAYNAGSDRVDDWLGQGKYRDPQEFVESIPFTETREYVQAIMRNASVYRQLYGSP
jgi:soluble lytic murein transglycosylase